MFINVLLLVLGIFVTGVVLYILLYIFSTVILAVAGFGIDLFKRKEK